MPNFEKFNNDAPPAEGVPEAQESGEAVEGILQKMKDRLMELDPEGVTPPEEYPPIGEAKD